MHWSIARKVKLGFVIMTVALVMLAMVSIASLLITRGAVGNMAALASASRVLMKTQKRTLSAQSRIKDYVIRPDEHLVGQVQSNLAQANEVIGDAEEGARKVDATEALARTQVLLKRFEASFAKIVAAQRAIRREADTKLTVIGPAIGNSLRAIAKTAHQRGQHDTAYRAGAALALYSQLRIDMGVYLADSSDASVKAAKADLLDLEDALNTLFEAIEDPDLSGRADGIIAKLVAFDKSFDTVVKLRRQRDREVDALLGATGPALEASIDEVIDALSDAQFSASLGAQVAAISAVIIVLIASGAGVAVAIAAGALTGRIVAAPIARMAEAMRGLASGDTNVQIPSARRGDEIGDMARAVQVFKENAGEIERRRAEEIEARRRELDRETELQREREAERHRAEADKRQALNALADSFERSVRHVVQSVSAAARQIESGARFAVETADANGRVTADVAAAAEQASQNAMTVANAAEEMARSIAEVSSQVVQSSAVADRAAASAATTDRIVTGLSADAERIGAVVELIRSIAEQTNLLALNATIEAARAGAAGRGFAVVASEIKSLATQTSEATVQIAQKVNSIQAVTHNAVSAIDDISTTISKIHGIATEVATVVEQQSQTTSEIARSTQQAAQGVGGVAQHIHRVHQGVAATGQAARDALAAAAELNRQASALDQEVERFLSRVRSA